MKLVESQLAGAQKMVLTANPTAQAERLIKAAGPGSRAQLWALPYETLRRRQKLGPGQVLRRIAASSPLYALPTSPLYRARALHLKGQFTDQESTTSFYQLARPSNDDLEQTQARACRRHPQVLGTHATESAGGVTSGGDPTGENNRGGTLGNDL